MFRNPLVYFLVWFFVLYGLLIFPWPGWNNTYARIFDAMGNLAFSHLGGSCLVDFHLHETQHNFTTLSAQIEMTNHAQVDSTGKSPGVQIEVDSRSIGWVPTALTAALILASPVPWRRRAWAFALGMVLINIFIMGSIWVWMWDVGPQIELYTFSPFWNEVADDLVYILINQLGASFSVPLVIWIFVTFRRSDAAIFDSVRLFFTKHLAP